MRAQHVQQVPWSKDLYSMIFTYQHCSPYTCTGRYDRLRTGSQARPAAQPPRRPGCGIGSICRRLPEQIKLVILDESEASAYFITQCSVRTCAQL